jgi:hypothetical protein
VETPQPEKGEETLQPETGNMRPINWIPNHYTALLPIDRVSDESVR